MPRNRAAFTLVEMLVVVAIIVVLIAILIPALAKAVRIANDAACLSNQGQVMKAVSSYAATNRTRLPFPQVTTGTLRNDPEMGVLDVWEVALLDTLGTDLQVLQCPNDEYEPGYQAAWWQANQGSAMTAASHHPEVQDEITDGVIQTVVPYSYVWSYKMYQPTTLTYTGKQYANRGQPATSYSIGSVRSAAGLMAVYCGGETAGVTGAEFNEGANNGPPASTSAPFKGSPTINGGFMDNHAATYSWDQITDRNSTNAAYGKYADGSKNIHLTEGGIAGRDVN